MRDSQWCLNHHPDRDAQRRRAGSKGGKRGGRGRPSAELKRLQAVFEGWADDVREGELSRADAAVMCQLLNGARACIRDAVHAREVEELTERMEAIEEALEQRQERPYSA
jgi:hypothetical protein